VRDVVTLLHDPLRSQVAGICGRPDENIHNMLPMPIDEGGDLVMVEVIEPAASQGEVLLREINYRRGEIQVLSSQGFTVCRSVETTSNR
jgi:hypothetical protein